MVPADQRLDPGEVVGAELDLGLVVQLELVAGEGEAQVALERLARLQPGVHAGLEEAEGVAAFLLGAIERDVGVLQQPARDRAVERDQRDADAGGDQHLVAVEVERRGERLEHAAAELLRAVGLLETDLDDRELVAADAGDGIGLAHAGLQALGAALDQQVAGGMAQQVVDVLEAVEIDADHRRDVAAPADRRHRLLEALAEQLAVGQLGQAGRAGRDTARAARPRSRR